MYTFSFLRRAALAGIFVATLTACNSTVDPQSNALYTNGVFVINSGNFFDNNGSLSWLTRDSKTAQTDLFQARNRRPLTGGLSDYVEVGNRGLILVDNSSAGLDKIEIVSTDSLRSVATLAAPDIENPRHAVRISDTKAYVSCWSTTGSTVYLANLGYVAVIDLTTNKITKKITVQKGAEGITVIGNEAYVASVDFSGSNVITIIDTQTDTVKQQLVVPADVNQLQLDANNSLWAFMGNNAIRINPSTKAIEATIPVGSATSTSSPGKLTPSGDRRSFYYGYAGKIYRFGITDATITPTTPVINRTFTSTTFTGLGFDTQSNVIYVGINPSYKQAGYVFRYQPTGQVIDSVKVEIGPSGFVFK